MASSKRLAVILMLQFYAILALEFFYVIPTSHVTIALSGLIFTLGLLLLVFKALRVLLQQNLILTWAFLIFVEVLTIWFYYKHTSFLTHFFDLGVFMQPLYSTLYGHQLFVVNASPNALRSVIVSPPDLHRPQSTFLFPTPFSPFLFFLLPFYAIYPDAITLSLLQNVAIGFPAFLIYGMMDDKRKSLWASLLYLGYSPIYYSAFFDFHSESFFPLFLFLSVYFMKKDIRKYYASIIILLSLNQAAPVFLLFFLPYIYFKTKRFMMVILTAVMAGAFVAANYAVSGYFVDIQLLLLPTVNSIFANIASDLSQKLTYVLFLFAPLLFLPLLEPLAVLPAGAWLAFGFIRNNFPFTSILFQYNMLVVAFLFIGFIGVSKLVDRKVLTLGILISLLVFMASWPPPGVGGIASTELPFSTPLYWNIGTILAQIPPSATVMASDNVFPHLANSMNTYFQPTFPPQWIILSKSDRNLGFQLPYVDYFLSHAKYNILENDSILFIANLTRT